MNIFAFKTIPKIKILQKSKFDKIPKCRDCKFNVQFGDIPVCTAFKYSTVTVENKVYNYFIESESCRENINLCGPDGYYFELR